MFDEGEVRAATAFKTAVANGDVASFLDALELVECHYAWEMAMRAVARISAPSHLRVAFAEAYMSDGDSLRSKVNNDPVLVKALRNLLPLFERPKDQAVLTLFRGANREERRYRRYGHSWTDDQMVARSHAKKEYHGSQGAVFEAIVPVEAVISAPWQVSETFHEREFVVDRRYLRDAKLKESFAESVRPEVARVNLFG